MIEALFDQGIIMWFFLLAIMGLFVFAFRAWFLAWRYARPKPVVEALAKLERDTLDPNESRRWLSVRTAVDLRKARRDYKENSIYPRTVVAESVRKNLLDRFRTEHLESISGFSNLLPPLGLMGTVAGMALHFLFHGQSGLEGKGISLALITTLVGLTAHLVIEVAKLRLPKMAESSVHMAIRDSTAFLGEEETVEEGTEGE